MCDKTVDTYPFVFDSAPDLYMTQKMYEKVVSKEPFMLNCCPNKYKTWKMCDKAVASFLSTSIKICSLLV